MPDDILDRIRKQNAQGQPSPTPASEPASDPVLSRVRGVSQDSSLHQPANPPEARGRSNSNLISTPRISKSIQPSSKPPAPLSAQQDVFGRPSLGTQLEKELADPNAGKVSPRVAAAERERKRYESRSFLGQRGEDIANAVISGSEPLIRVANRALRAYGSPQGPDILPTLTPEARANLQQKTEAAQGIIPEVTRGLAGAAVQMPAIIAAGTTGGLPGIAAYTAAGEDYTDPIEAAKRIAINTAIPAGAGKLAGRLAAPLITSAANPATRQAVRIGTEALGGAAGNVAAAGAMGESDPEKLIAQGIIGGGIGGALGARRGSPPERFGPRDIPVRQQVANVQNEPLPYPRMNRMNRAPIARPQTEIIKAEPLESVARDLQAAATTPEEQALMREIIAGRMQPPAAPPRAAAGPLGRPNIPANQTPIASPEVLPRPLPRGSGLGAPNIPDAMTQTAAPEVAPVPPRRSPLGPPNIKTSAPTAAPEVAATPPRRSPMGGPQIFESAPFEPPRRQPIAPRPRPIDRTPPSDLPEPTGPLMEEPPTPRVRREPIIEERSRPPVDTETPVTPRRQPIAQQPVDRSIQARLDWIQRATPEQLDRSIAQLERAIPNMTPEVAGRQRQVLKAANERRRELTREGELAPKFPDRPLAESTRLNKGAMQQMEGMGAEERAVYQPTEEGRQAVQTARNRRTRDAKVAANQAARGIVEPTRKTQPKAGRMATMENTATTTDSPELATAIERFKKNNIAHLQTPDGPLTVKVVSHPAGDDLYGVEVTLKGDRRYHIEEPLKSEEEAIEFGINQLRNPRPTQTTPAPVRAEQKPLAAEPNQEQALRIDPYRIAAEAKAQGIDATAAYSQYVKAWGLRGTPLELSAKQFQEIYRNIDLESYPDLQAKAPSPATLGGQGFTPTHINKATGERIQATPDEGFYRLVYERTGTGTVPNQFFTPEYGYEPIGKPTSEPTKPPQNVALPQVETVKPPDTYATHKDFGNVTLSENQKRVPKGKVRVTDAQGKEHIIQKTNNNQSAIRAKKEAAPTPPETLPVKPVQTGEAEAAPKERVAGPRQRPQERSDAEKRDAYYRGLDQEIGQKYKGKRQQVELTNRDGSKETVNMQVFGNFGIHNKKGRWGVTHMPTKVAAGWFDDQATAKRVAYRLENEAGDWSFTDAKQMPKETGANAQRIISEVLHQKIPEGAAIPERRAEISAGDVAARSRSEKENPRTGLTPSQEQYITTRLPALAETLDAKQPTPTTIKVPGDGQFTVSTPQQANNLNRRITGQDIEGYRSSDKGVKRVPAPSVKVPGPATYGVDDGARAALKIYGTPEKAIEALNKQLDVQGQETDIDQAALTGMVISKLEKMQAEGKETLPEQSTIKSKYPPIEQKPVPEPQSVADTIRELKPKGGPASIADLRAKGVSDAEIQKAIDNRELSPVRTSIKDYRQMHGEEKTKADLLDGVIGVEVARGKRAGAQKQPDVLEGMRQVEPQVDTGAPVSLTDLRAKMKGQFPTKEAFDKAILEMAERGDIRLQRHVFPDSLSEGERAGLVLGEGFDVDTGKTVPAYYLGAALSEKLQGQAKTQPSTGKTAKAKPKFVEDAEARLKEAASGKRAGSGAQALIDQAIVTGHQLYRAGMTFADWSAQVVKQAGEKVRPHLRAVWDQLNERVTFGPDPRTREGVENSRPFKRWFGDSKVVDEQGKPKVVYHSTQGDFDTFRDTADVGFHFGTAKAANDRAETPTYFKNYGSQPYRDKSSVMPAYLSIKNPLKVGDVFSTSTDTLERLIELGHIDANDPNFANIKTALRKGEIDSKEALRLRRTAMVTALEEQGYDGIEYTNQAEDPGSTSYVAFRPEQIKSATGNRGTFSGSTGNIMGTGFGSLQGGFGGKKPPQKPKPNIGRVNLAALQKITGEGKTGARTPKGATTRGPKAQEPASIPEKISTFRKAGFLGGIPTHIKNMLGNTFMQAAEEGARGPGAVVDMLASTVTGKRTLAGPSAGAVARAGWEGGKKGIAEAKEILRKGQSAEDVARTQRTDTSYKTKILQGYTQMIFRSLSAEDAVFRNVALRRALEGRAKMQAVNEARQRLIPRSQVSARAKQLVDAPPADMEMGAIEDSLVAVFQNKNAISRGTEAFKQELTPGGRLAMDLFLPYDKTPTNLILKTLDYSPAGFVRAAGQATNAASRAVKSVRGQRAQGQPVFDRRTIKKAIDDAISPEQQKAFAETMGRATTGSAALLTLGAILGNKGIITGFYGDKDEEKRNEAAGKQPGSLIIGGRSWKIADFGPPGQMLVLGATLAREYNRPLKDEDERPKRMLTAAGQMAASVPFLESARQADEILRGEGKTGQKLGRLAGGFVPTVGNIGKMLDPYEREGNVLGGAGEIVKQIPIARNFLPRKEKATGEEMRPGFAERAIGLIDPTQSKPVKETPGLSALEDLGMGIGLVKKKTDESEEQFKARNAKAREMYQPALDALSQHPAYEALSTEDKREVVEGLKARITREVGREYPRTELFDPDILIQSVLSNKEKRAEKRRSMLMER